MKNTAVLKLKKYWGMYLKWYGKTQVRSYELQLTSYELQVTSSKLKSTSWNLKVGVQIHELRVQIQELLVNFTRYESKITKSNPRFQESLNQEKIK